MEDYELAEVESKNIRKENVKILEDFESYLREKKLSNKTIAKHLNNVKFYINEYLHYDEPTTASKGIDRIGYFLGDWFIRKAMWSSVPAIKENISSLKHFYVFLNGIGKINSDQLIELKEEIKENKNEWFESSRKYDDPDFDLEDDW